MPRREDIEKFTEILNSLGDEPAIRAARSEPSPPDAQPGADQGESLDSLPPGGELSGLEDQGGTGFESAGAEAETGIGEDFFQGLAALPEETPGPAAGRPSEGPPPEATEEGIDFSSLFAEETEPQPIEDLEAKAPRETGEGEGPAQAEPPVSPEEQFGFPEGEPAGLQADLSQMEVLPDDFGLTPPSSTEETPAEPGADLGSFEDLGAFPLEEPGAAGVEPAAPASAEEPAQGPELPSIDELTFGEPTTAGPTEPSAEPIAAEPSTEEFQTPSFEGFDLDTATGFETPGEEPQAGAFEEPQAGAFEEPQAGAFEEPQAGAFEEPQAGAFEEPQAGAFEEPQAAPFEEPSPAAEPPGETPSEEALPQMESLGEEASLGDLNLEDFSLPESADQFGVAEEAPQAPPPPPPRPAPSRAAPRPAPAKPRPAPTRPAAPSEELAGAEEEISLTPEQFARLKQTLDSLPRNLKIVVQDLVGEGAVSGPNLPKLISLLVEGASAQEIATLVGRITGKRIRVPVGYEKKTGIAFEAERRTFGYALRENIFPLVRVLLLTALAGAILAFFGYRFVYRPLYAYANYRTGYHQIANDRFTLANERFDTAVNAWPVKGWFYRYAEAFAARRQYVLAEEKYDQLLARYRGDRKAILDYADMESTKLADYEKADRLLRLILDEKMYDYDALLASGDNQIRWAERDPAKYEAARLTYATLIDNYGPKDDLLFRMLRYFIRTGNSDEVERLRVYYASRPDVKVDPDVYAELGGFLVDHRRLDYVQDVLFRADKVKPGLPEVHYNLARYYRVVGNPPDEKKALDHVVRLLSSTDALTHRRLTIEIDTHTRLGEYYARTKEYITAEKELETAIRLVEQNQKMKLIGRESVFGRPYADLGDLSYYIQGDLVSAGTLFQTAIDNSYTGPELTYKIGYIQYFGQDFKTALTTFSSAEDASAYPSGIEPSSAAATASGGPVAAPAPGTGPVAEGAEAAPGGAGAAAPSAESASPAPGRPSSAGRVPVNLLFALGNCFYERGDFFAAQGYYLQVKDKLETQRAAIGTLLPEVRPEDRALLQYLVKVYNNLGVTMIRISERTGDRNRRSEALVTLTTATEIADSLAKIPGMAQRNETRSVPALNMQGILYPTRKFVVQIYQPIAKDFEATSW